MTQMTYQIHNSNKPPLTLLLIAMGCTISFQAVQEGLEGPGLQGPYLGALLLCGSLFVGQVEALEEPWLVVVGLGSVSVLLVFVQGCRQSDL